jgi:hypothetical protein
MKKKAKFVIRTVAVLLGTIGFIGFMAGAFVGNVVEIPDEFELPLGALEGIAVDSEGNIYCGVQYYHRVQVYNSEGHYIRGTFVDSAGGSFRIRINQNDELEVATVRNDKLYRFGKDGTLVTELSDVDHYFDEFGETGETQYYDERQNVTYQIKWSPFGAYVIKRSASGEPKVIVKTPFHKWLFQGPYPAWFFGIVGAIVYGCTMKHPLNYLLGLDRIDKDKCIFWKIKRALEEKETH